MSQWNMIANPAVNPHECGQMTSDGCAEDTQCGKDRFRQKESGKLGIYMQKNEAGPLSFTIYKK